MAEVDIALEYCLGLVLGSVQECRHDTVVQTRTYGRSRLFDAPPIELDEDAETEDGADRPLDELF